MKREEFHDKPYDEGTLTKLRIFELYVQEWIPVFLAKPDSYFEEIHIFDFFAGPGRDANGVAGSPLRILEQLRRYEAMGLAGWHKMRKTVHFFDLNEDKIRTLQQALTDDEITVSGVQINVRALEFTSALKEYRNVFLNPKAAKILIIDQFGVDAVSDTVFRELVSFPTTDFIFFLSSSTLHRFRDHPAIKQKIPHPEDSYHVHRAAFDYYQSTVPTDMNVFLGQFSIRKRSNIYGLVFGSQHPLGIHKFLQVAWKNDKIAGEANFDVDRENIGEGEMLFDFDEMKPKKIQNFESSLEEALRAKRFTTEGDIVRFCIQAGMTCQHAAPVISKLKSEHFLKCVFKIPDVRQVNKDPRVIEYQ
jgi:three-Cys-motif partner protein